MQTQPRLNFPATVFVQVDFTGDASVYSNSFLAPAYFGARVSSAGISGLTFTQSSAGNFDLSSFEVGTGASEAATPEIGTLLSMGAGLLLVSVLKRRSRPDLRGR